jgi:hypothetical protein
MDKRYQVFVSSTYADLKEERQHVLQALMEMDCIPAGMELFPAADEEQWSFIQKVIDDCDYYLLIIGGRYGSVTPDGISYTEKEFDYAVDRGLKIVALIHGEPDNIPFGKSESDTVLRDKLFEFRDKVMDGRLVKFWKSAEELPGLVALSLTKTIKMYPAIGWVRANKIASDDLLMEINQLRKENTSLSNDLSKMTAQENNKINDIADIDSTYTIHGNYKISRGHGYEPYKKTWESEISWREIFSLISPYLLEHPNDGSVKLQLEQSLRERESLDGYSHHINDQEFKTITLQLIAYNLIQTDYLKTTKGGMALFWKLTTKGEQFMMENRVIK